MTLHHIHVSEKNTTVGKISVKFKHGIETHKMNFQNKAPITEKSLNINVLISMCPLFGGLWTFIGSET